MYRSTLWLGMQKRGMHRGTILPGTRSEECIVASYGRASKSAECVVAPYGQASKCEELFVAPYGRASKTVEFIVATYGRAPSSRPRPGLFALFAPTLARVAVGMYDHVSDQFDCPISVMQIVGSDRQYDNRRLGVKIFFFSVPGWVQEHSSY